MQAYSQAWNLINTLCPQVVYQYNSGIFTHCYVNIKCTNFQLKYFCGLSLQRKPQVLSFPYTAIHTDSYTFVTICTEGQYLKRFCWITGDRLEWWIVKVYLLTQSACTANPSQAHMQWTSFYNRHICPALSTIVWTVEVSKISLGPQALPSKYLGCPGCPCRQSQKIQVAQALLSKCVGDSCRCPRVSDTPSTSWQHRLCVSRCLWCPGVLDGHFRV